MNYTAKKEGEKRTIVAKSKQVIPAGHKADLSVSLLSHMTTLSETTIKQIIQQIKTED